MTAPDPAAEVLVPPPPAPPRGRAQQNIFPNYRMWFDTYFSPLWTRPKRYNWCQEWEKHQEAKMVIDLLWKTWELAMDDGDPNTMVVWLRDFAYDLMAKLTDDGGTFTGCDWMDDDAPRHAPDAVPLS